jgi:DNA-binding XRE family transcriptional regulator
MLVEFDVAEVQFGVYLRMLRQRIPPQTSILGTKRRLPARCGRPVTQEELAELAGVSRNWYRRLECGEGFPSMRLVNRLAQAFVLSVEERMTLFALALNEMSNAP